MSRIMCVLLCALLATAGCKKAERYSAEIPEQKTPLKEDDAPDKSLPETYAWMDTDVTLVRPGDARIEFVHQGSNPEEWAKLNAFWNDPAPNPLGSAIGVLGGQPLGKAALITPSPIQVKVPLGLDDPSAYIPASNPPTKAKWELGRKLFFDTGWLSAKGNQSCAKCHWPELGFANGQPASEGGYNVPTLINVVYNSHQFWDGRAVYLEEVVQRKLEDEREPTEKGFTHTWHGVIGRLRKDKTWTDEFNRVFGVAPTQDTVGKALATYMRTLLSGDSIHDRAVAVQQKKNASKLLAEHYEAVLDDSALSSLSRSKEAKSKIAADLAKGHELFRGKAGCAACHTPGNGNFTDGRFYNIGVESEKIDAKTGARVGRFAWAPYGEKNRYQKGAYKVPTLRSLSRTGPYFHDGSAKDLVEAVRFHVKPPAKDSTKDSKSVNLYLDKRLADDMGNHRDLGLSEQDVADVVLFLQALDGGAVDESVRKIAN